MPKKMSIACSPLWPSHTSSPATRTYAHVHIGMYMHMGSACSCGTLRRSCSCLACGIMRYGACHEFPYARLATTDMCMLAYPENDIGLLPSFVGTWPLCFASL